MVTMNLSLKLLWFSIQFFWPIIVPPAHFFFFFYMWKGQSLLTYSFFKLNNFKIIPLSWIWIQNQIVHSYMSLNHLFKALTCWAVSTPYIFICTHSYEQQSKKKLHNIFLLLMCTTISLLERTCCLFKFIFICIWDQCTVLNMNNQPC